MFGAGNHFSQKRDVQGIQSVNSTNITRRIVRIIILSNLITCVFLFPYCFIISRLFNESVLRNVKYNIFDID